MTSKPRIKIPAIKDTQSPYDAVVDVLMDDPVALMDDPNAIMVPSAVTRDSAKPIGVRVAQGHGK